MEQCALGHVNIAMGRFLSVFYLFTFSTIITNTRVWQEL